MGDCPQSNFEERGREEPKPSGFNEADWKRLQKREQERDRFIATCFALAGISASGGMSMKPEQIAQIAVDRADAALDRLRKTQT